MLPPLSTLSTILFDEQKCLQFLLDERILYNRELCQLCSSEVRIEGKVWRCKNRQCRKKFSLLHESFFAKSKLKCCEMLLLCYLWLAKASYSTIIALTGHSSATVTEFMGHCRSLVFESLDDQDDMIGGPGIVVEIDESKFGKRKYHRGHPVEGVWVLGGIERTDAKKVFITSVPDRCARTLLGIISTRVRQGSVIYTDLWGGYAGLNQDLGYEHFTVNHSENFVDPDTGVHTNMIEGFWNGLKLRIAPRNRTMNCIDNHLFECIWRKKHADSLWDGLLASLKEVGYF
jgi:hypothetical protein